MRVPKRLPLLLGILSLAAIPAVEAAIITVTGTGDAVAADGDCTLREAIQAANTDTPVNECALVPEDPDLDPGVDHIEFDIPGTGPHTIVPLSALPDIVAPVFIDGATQPGASCPDTPLIVINGANAGSVNGLTITGDGSTLSGLVINGFDFGYGILITGSDNLVECSFVGTDPAGTTAVPNHIGIGISGVIPELRSFHKGVLATGNVVGVADDAGSRNVISGNAFAGVEIGFGATGNRVSGNYVGTTAAGTAALANEIGVSIFFAGSNLVGIDGNGEGGEGETTSDDAERNVISGNTLAGVEIQGPFNDVRGNFIGTDATGTGAVGNGVGVSLGLAPFQNPQLRRAPTKGEVAADEALVHENLIAHNSTGILLSGGDFDVVFQSGSQDNCVVGNTDGVVNDLFATVTFTNNWWGASDGPSPPGSGSGDSALGSIDFAPPLTQTAEICKSTILIVKDTVPDDAQDFSFSSVALGPFSLDDDGDPTLPNSKSFEVAPGTYVVSEDDPLPLGFNLTGLNCVDSAAGGTQSSASRSSRTATIELDLAETVTCTFTNVRVPVRIEKSTNGFDADLAPGPGLLVGTPVTWTYVVTNLDAGPLFGVSVSDDQEGAASCPQSSLAAGESMTCTINGTVQAGLYANVGTASGFFGAEDFFEVSDPSHYFGQAAALLTLEKLTEGVDADTPPGPALAVGGSVSWTYVLTNVGSEILTNIAVTDDQGVSVSCPLGTLGAGLSMTCTASGTVEPGQYANLGSAIADSSVGQVVASDPSHYFGQSIELEKATNGFDADDPLLPGPVLAVGAPVTWTYEVMNPGPSAVTGIVVSDDQGVSVSCPQSTLDARASMTCSAVGTAAEGQYANLGTVIATLAGGGTVTASDPSHYFGGFLRIEKSTNGVDADDPPGPQIPFGDPVNWTYVVTNLGTVALPAVFVADDQGVAVSCPQTSLAAGESMTCTANSTAEVGQYANLGEVRLNDPDPATAPVAADPSHYVGQVIRVEKSTNGFDADEVPGPFLFVGDPVTWEYVVTNLGATPLDDVSVLDDQGVTVSCPLTVLGAGESMTCTAVGTVEVGQYANLGIAAEGGAIDETSGFLDSDRSHYFGLPLKVEKSTNGADADLPPGPALVVGSVVTWEYEVTNLESGPLLEIAVVDDQGVAVSCPKGTLAVGESMTCTATGTVQPDPYANLGTASALFDGERYDTSDPSHYFGTEAIVTVATEVGPLAFCDTVREPIDRLLVSFVGQLPFQNADDALSYLLVGTGADDDFSTTACGGAAGDDVPIEIVSLSLTGIDPVTVTAELGLGGPLAPGLYRFFVCDAITDGNGDPIDGDGDGSLGGDFLLPFFRADPSNLFANGHFDDCPVTLEPWTAAATAPNVIQPGVPGTDDSAASPLSASARVSHSSAEASAFGQCAPVEGGLIYDFKRRVRFQSPMGAVALFATTCELFDGADCNGTSLGQVSSISVLEDSGGAWSFLTSEVVVPGGAVSALCDFTIEAAGGGSPELDAFFDGLFLGPGASIFADGFESGDVSAWSSQVP